ncbi:hypothetical protein K523DRAFT_358738 [Schizophyllum commune Tattone D]|nr:hypothetical protein K523DRAFT_358738 [Schizophyllum commune Tattone D]
MPAPVPLHLPSPFFITPPIDSSAFESHLGPHHRHPEPAPQTTSSPSPPLSRAYMTGGLVAHLSGHGRIPA